MFSQTLMDLARRYYEQGDNGFALHDCLLEEGFDHLALVWLKEEEKMGAIGLHDCPTAQYISEGNPKYMGWSPDVARKLEEQKKCKVP